MHRRDLRHRPGELLVRGRLSPFIELGVGFNIDLTARDNITINAIMLGLTRKQARERFDEIIDFAELQDFLDLRLKNYSSGMHVRLAFSVAIQVEAEILLIDEVLAVGDAAFQQKCFDEFQRLKREGRTILFVTHDMREYSASATARCCSRRAGWSRSASPATVARRYNQLNFGRTVHLDTGAGSPPRAAPAAEIVDAWFEDAAGERIAAIAHGEPCCACIEVRFNEAIDDPIFGVTLRNEVGATVFATTTALDHGPTGRFDAPSTTIVRHALRELARGEPLQPDAVDRPQWPRRGRDRPARGHRVAGRPRRARQPAASPTSRTGSRSTRDERRRGPSARGGTKPAASRPVGLRRRPPPLRQPDLMLAVTDFKLRYFGSVLGYLWSLVRPLLFFGVLYFVFTKIFTPARGSPTTRVPADGDHVVDLLRGNDPGVGAVPARPRGAAAQDALPSPGDPAGGRADGAVQPRDQLGRRARVRRRRGISPRVSWLELPVLVALLAILAVGIGMLLSVLYVRFRDIPPIWDVTSQMLFYGSPIIYTAAKIPANRSCARDVQPDRGDPHADGPRLHRPDEHSAAVLIGGAVRLLIPLGIIGGMFALGLWFFNREAPRIAERL